MAFPDKQKLDYQKIKKIFKDKNKCYLVLNNTIEPIVIFSETTKWVRTLYPTQSAPTTLVSGTLMNRIKNITPNEDTNRKITAISPLKNVLIFS